MREFFQDRKVLGFVTGMGFFILLYLAVFIFPSLNRINFLKEAIPQKEEEVSEMQTLKKEYLGAKKEDVGLPISSQDGESIFSLVERVAKTRGLAENIISIKPVASAAAVRTDSSARDDFQEASVEVKMKNLSLQNIVSYLYTLESAPYRLTIKDLQITSPKERLSLELAFTASRLEKK